MDSVLCRRVKLALTSLLGVWDGAELNAVLGEVSKLTYESLLTLAVVVRIAV